MKGKLFERLKKDALSAPMDHAVIAVLLGVGFASLPLFKLFPQTFGNLGNSMLFWGGLLRFIIAGVCITFAIGYGFSGEFMSSAGAKSYLALIPALLVVVNNAPIIGMANGGKITGDGVRIALFVFYCLSVATFEETLFRGLAFPLVFMRLSRTRRPLFYSVACSSAIFAAAHLLNVFSGASVGGVILQTGYSFLIGGLCAISLITIKNIYIPIVFHFIYDLGGLCLDSQTGIAVAAQWDAVTIIITAVLGVLVAAYMLLLLLKSKKERIYDIFGTSLLLSGEKSVQTDCLKNAATQSDTDGENEKNDRENK